MHTLQNKTSKAKKKCFYLLFLVFVFDKLDLNKTLVFYLLFPETMDTHWENLVEKITYQGSSTLKIFDQSSITFFHRFYKNNNTTYERTIL